MTESSVELQTVDGYTAETVTSKTLKATVLYQYNSKGELQKKRYLADGQDHAYFVEHRDDGSQVYTLPTGVVSHSKNDHLGRLEFDELQLGKGFISRRFSYHDGEATYKHVDNNMLKSSPTTTLVSSILLSDGSTLSYEYDAEEKITAVTEKRMVSGAPVETKYEYTYDNLGQLLTETVNGTAVNTMTYDYYGNILSKNGKKYEYGNSAWKDLLTAYDGQEITYDAGGNPISYLGHTLAWEKGRQLKSFDDITYTYNANGIRTAKTVDGVRHDYIVDGTNIQRETWTQNGVQHTLVPLYDNTEAVCGIIHNDAAYYFLKNLQGDVIAITDDVGQVVARYTYDAWGVCTVESDQTDCGIANLNPYRYRAYYYDSEIGMYYLQSRYYDPQVGRFINGDSPDIITAIKVKNSDNLYCYCSNDPVNETDECGNLIVRAIAKFILYAIFGVFAQFVSDIIECLLRRFIKNKKVSFKLSPLGDYLGSALSWGMCSLNLFNNKLAAFLAPFVPVLIKHLANIIKGTFTWQALLIDAAAALIAGILSVALNKTMKSKLSRVKRAKGNRYDDYAKFLRKRVNIVLRINKSFLKMSITIVITTTFSQILLNLLLKKS